MLGVLGPISEFMTPLTVGWLKLPLFAGILLIVGIVRKEFVLLTLVSFVGTDLSLALNFGAVYCFGIDWECCICHVFQL